MQLGLLLLLLLLAVTFHGVFTTLLSQVDIHFTRKDLLYNLSSVMSLEFHFLKHCKLSKLRRVGTCTALTRNDERLIKVVRNRIEIVAQFSMFIFLGARTLLCYIPVHLCFLCHNLLTITYAFACNFSLIYMTLPWYYGYTLL